MHFGPPLIAGKLVFGVQDLGIPGSVIRATTGTGEHGEGLLNNDWDPGDDDKLFRALIITPPSAGVLFLRENGSGSFTDAPDGAYSFVYQTIVDGVALDPAVTVNIVIGSGASASITELGVDTASGSAFVGVGCYGVGAELGQDVVAASSYVLLTGTAASIEGSDGMVASGGATVTIRTYPLAGLHQTFPLEGRT